MGRKLRRRWVSLKRKMRRKGYLPGDLVTFLLGRHQRPAHGGNVGVVPRVVVHHRRPVGQRSDLVPETEGLRVDENREAADLRQRR